MKFWFAVLIILTLSFSACQMRVDSPFSTEVKTDLRAHNSAVLSRLNTMTALNTHIRVGIITDSHQDYDDLEPTIQKLNAMDVDFVIHMGDFTNFGTNAEYDAFASIIQKLRHPYFIIIGNHDSIGAGHALYRKIFGEYTAG